MKVGELLDDLLERVACELEALHAAGVGVVQALLYRRSQVAHRAADRRERSAVARRQPVALLDRLGHVLAQSLDLRLRERVLHALEVIWA